MSTQIGGERAHSPQWGSRACLHPAAGVWRRPFPCIFCQLQREYHTLIFANLIRLKIVPLCFVALLLLLRLSVSLPGFLAWLPLPVTFSSILPCPSGVGIVLCYVALVSAVPSEQCIGPYLSLAGNLMCFWFCFYLISKAVGKLILHQSIGISSGSWSIPINLKCFKIGALNMAF